ncbi:transcriptional regulator [Amycolatopsis antarctica]|uniref:Transcriptional regulator n=1 Tax=Amycolatopsis antarctica TaxID=1854586 RepID=A0A263D0C1_9PSEU|nr:helix-turn-helix domain-containing protein [Amycolatopsis antarctica]OZM71872.1 transcriptional regulator [Amycolatopsis antarctica]
MPGGRTTGDASGERLAAFAGLLADRTRATLCLALLDGRAWTAGELAAYAGVGAPTTTSHLDRLTEAGLLVQRRQGRHRYVQLAGPDVAELLEDLVARLGPVPGRGRSLRASTVAAALARGRTCYDHLAGRLGVTITEAMTTAGFLDRSAGLSLTAAGIDWYATDLGVDPTSLRATRRPVARDCLDWTERRSHLAGAAGARLCETLLARGWTVRAGSGRAVRLTGAGERALGERLPLDVAALRG